MNRSAVYGMLAAALLRLRTSAVAASKAALPAHPMVVVPQDFERVVGAGLRKRQKSSFLKGRAAKGRFAGAAGKCRP